MRSSPPRPRSVAFVGLVAALALGASAGPAAASHVTCGQVLKKDTTLDSDLTGCPGDGLVIGRSGITVDLNGHTVDGAVGSDVGIDASGGYDRVRIVDGEVTGFRTGVLLRDSARSVVRRIEVSDAGGGIQLHRVVRAQVTRNRADTRFTALSVLESDRNLIADNVLVGDSSLSVSDSDRNVIEGNTVPRGRGFRITDSNRNTIEENTVVGTIFSGIELTSGARNALRWNETSSNSFAGLIVGQAARDTEVRGNVASRNSRDGITVLSPSTRLRRNSATFNGELGINAPNGAIDGGGNRAFGNGDPRQCVGVACAG